MIAKLVSVLLGGRPMEQVELAFIDRVSGKPVYRWRDKFGRYWLAESAWSRFRVRTQFQGTEELVRTVMQRAR